MIELTDQPDSLAPLEFLDQFGRPGTDPEQVQAWLGRFQENHNYSAIGVGATMLPLTPPATNAGCDTTGRNDTLRSLTGHGAGG